MAKKKELTPEELEQQADALLAAADAAEAEVKPTKKASKKATAEAAAATPHVMTDEEAKKADLKFARDYLGLNPREGFNWGIIRGGMGSVAKLFVAQMQDYLELGKGHRLNTPGTTEGNWQWRMLEGEASDKLAKRIFEMSVLYGRTEQSVEEKKTETKKAE